MPIAMAWIPKRNKMHIRWDCHTSIRNVFTARSLGQGNVFARICHSVHEGGGSLSRGRGLPTRDSLSGGSLSGGSLSRGSLSGGSLSRSLCPGGLIPGGSLSGGQRPPYGKEQAVRIPLECILVFLNVSKCVVFVHNHQTRESILNTLFFFQSIY